MNVYFNLKTQKIVLLIDQYYSTKMILGLSYLI